MVVSAMGKTTDDLVRLAHEVSSSPAGREMDMLLTSGERISIALLCMAIIDRGEPSVSFTGLPGRDRHRHDAHEGQDPRRPDRAPPGRARRRQRRGGRRLPGRLHRHRHHDARAGRLRHDRGGARRRARRRGLRDLHRRRRGVHRRSAGRARTPGCWRACPTTRCSRWPRPAGGCSRCARSSSPATTGCPVHVRSSFTWEPGTWVDEAGQRSRTRWRRRDGTGDHLGRHPRHVRGQGHDRSTSPTVPAWRRGCSALLADEAVNVDMIVQNVSSEGHTDISFTVPRDDLPRALKVMDARGRRGRGGRRSPTTPAIGRVSLVGAGMKTNPGVAAKMFEVARRRRCQHRDDLDVDDPDLVRGRRSPTSSGRCGRCTGPSSSTPSSESGSGRWARREARR